MPLHRLTQPTINLFTPRPHRSISVRGRFPTMTRATKRPQRRHRMIVSSARMVTLGRGRTTLNLALKDLLAHVPVALKHPTTNRRPIRRKARRPPRSWTINQHNLLQVGVERFELSLKRILSHAASACWATHPKITLRNTAVRQRMIARRPGLEPGSAGFGVRSLSH